MTGRDAAPDAGDTLSAATGGATAVTDRDAVLLAPLVSVTVTVTVNRPGELYVWPAVAPG